MKKFIDLLNQIFDSKMKWIIFMSFHFIFRLPYFLNSEKRMHGDEAFHWLVNQANIDGNFTLHPFNHSYLGVTDFLFVLPFYPFFGNSGLSNQLGLWLMYGVFSFFMVKATELLLGKKESQLVYYLHLIPSSFLMILSATYHGGHFGAYVFWTAGFYFYLKMLQKDSNQIDISSAILLGGLWGLSYYTSHLTLLSIGVYLPLCIFFLLILNLQNIKLVFRISFFILIGLVVGLIPEALGKFIIPFEANHNSDFLARPFFFWKNNLYVLLHYEWESIVGIFAHPFMRYYGFFFGAKEQTVIYALSIILTIVLISFPIIFIFKSIREKGLKVNNFLFYFFVGYFALFTITFILILCINKELDDFGVRYLMPVISISPFLFAYAAYSLKEKNIKFFYTLVSLVFIINIAGYLQGYTRKAFYEFEGSPGAKEVSEFLKSKDIKYSFANHWITYNLIKNSKQEHLSAPFIGENIHNPPMHDFIEKQSNTETIAIIQMDVLLDWHRDRLKTNEKNEKYMNMAEGKYKVLEEKLINRWQIYICKKEH